VRATALDAGDGGGVVVAWGVVVGAGGLRIDDSLSTCQQVSSTQTLRVPVATDARVQVGEVVRHYEARLGR